MHKTQEKVELEKYGRRIQPFLLKGDYVSALKIARESLRRYPRSIQSRYLYAKVLGDYADEAPATRKKKLKKEATGILKSLLPRLRGMSVKSRFGICLNYYYQSEKYREMYRFGRRFERQERSRAIYAQGLAAGLVAFEEHESGHRATTTAWARKSVQAWRRYDLKKEKYYFAHYSFAKSLALADRKAEALARLKTAARLGRRPITDWEFADVLVLLKSANSK